MDRWQHLLVTVKHVSVWENQSNDGVFSEHPLSSSILTISVLFSPSSYLSHLQQLLLGNSSHPHMHTYIIEYRI